MLFKQNQWDQWGIWLYSSKFPFLSISISQIVDFQYRFMNFNLILCSSYVYKSNKAKYVNAKMINMLVNCLGCMIIF